MLLFINVTYIKYARTFVLFVLLSYTGQVVGVGAHSAVMYDLSYDAVEASPPCHGKGEQNAMAHDMETLNELNEPQSCCDNGCSMLGCHATSVILASFTILTFTSPHTGDFAFIPSLTSTSINTLYRPPILG